MQDDPQIHKGSAMYMVHSRDPSIGAKTLYTVQQQTLLERPGSSVCRQNHLSPPWPYFSGANSGLPQQWQALDQECKEAHNHKGKCLQVVKHVTMQLHCFVFACKARFNSLSFVAGTRLCGVSQAVVLGLLDTVSFRHVWLCSSRTLHVRDV